MIPKLGELRQLRQVDATTNDNEVVRSRSAGMTALFVVASLITVATLLVAGYNAVRWAMIETDVTIETHLDDISHNYAAAEPGSMVVEFEQMEENSLDLIAPYTYQTKVNEKNSWGKNALIATGLAILFAALAIFSAVRGRSETPTN